MPLASSHACRSSTIDLGFGVACHLHVIEPEMVRAAIDSIYDGVGTARQLVVEADVRPRRPITGSLGMS